MPDCLLPLRGIETRNHDTSYWAAACRVANPAAQWELLDPGEKSGGGRMNETVVVTPELILEVTEDLLRRFRAGQARSVDLPLAPRLSHGASTSFSRARLRAAARPVAKRWPRPPRNAAAENIAERVGGGPSPARLDAGLRTLFAIKPNKVCDDPICSRTYLALAQESW